MSLLVRLVSVFPFWHVVSKPDDGLTASNLHFAREAHTTLARRIFTQLQPHPTRQPNLYYPQPVNM